jgi:hypothetical protein
MSLILALVLFTAYVANVVLGATANAALLGDVGEMLLLFAASVAFTAAILKREKDAANQKDKNP